MLSWPKCYTRNVYTDTHIHWNPLSLNVKIDAIKPNSLPSNHSICNEAIRWTRNHWTKNRPIFKIMLLTKQIHRFLDFQLISITCLLLANHCYNVHSGSWLCSNFYFNKPMSFQWNRSAIGSDLMACNIKVQILHSNYDEWAGGKTYRILYS